MGAEKVIDFREADPDCPRWNRKLRWLFEAYQEAQDLKSLEAAYQRTVAGLGTDRAEWYNDAVKSANKLYNVIDEIRRPWIDPSQRVGTRKLDDWSELSQDEAMKLWANSVGVDLDDPNFDYEAELAQAQQALRENFPTTAEVEAENAAMDTDARREELGGGATASGQERRPSVEVAAPVRR